MSRFVKTRRSELAQTKANTARAALSAAIDAGLPNDELKPLAREMRLAQYAADHLASLVA